MNRVFGIALGVFSLSHFWLLSITLLTNSNTDILVNGQLSCTPAYCSAYGKCPQFSCRGKNKITFRNVTTCGCCHRCVEEKDEGDECPDNITGNIPAIQCGPHLKCVNEGKFGKCRKINSECENEPAKYEDTSSQSINKKGMPVCDQFGEFTPKQCKNGTICQCVNDHGKPIFGMAPYNEAKNMNCLCSRQFELVNRKLREMHSKPIVPINFMRCKENGNFETYQRHMHYVYCVHQTNGTMWDRPVVASAAKELPCFESRYLFKTNCITKYNEAIGNITKLEQDGYQIVGFDVPQCELDGSYAPVQCLNDKCYCADQMGKPLRGPKGKKLEVSRSDPFAQNMKCSCARHLEKIRSIKPPYRNKATELFGRYQCDINGNYLPVQCSDTACYCVDPLTGFSQKFDNPEKYSNALKSEPESIKRLYCYIEYAKNLNNKIRLNELLRIPNN